MNNKAIQEMLSKGQQKAQEKVDFNNQLYEENSIIPIGFDCIK